jgi:hypothetical protein
MRDWSATRAIEDVGCTNLLVSDHFGDQMALIPALATAIQAPSRVRGGALAACNDYRHPVTYAKELATMDVLSEGRVDRRKRSRTLGNLVLGGVRASDQGDRAGRRASVGSLT